MYMKKKDMLMKGGNADDDLGSARPTQGWPRGQGQVPCLSNKGYPSRFAAPRSFDFPSFQVLQNRSFWTCEESWR